MARWQLSVDLGGERDASSPVFARIARSISDDIARGRLASGQRLPGTRALAETLGVHRNTVVAAFDELVSQGWIETHPARGTFVAGVPEPSHGPKSGARSPRAIATKPAFALRLSAATVLVSPDPKGALLLAGGRPDARLFPGELLARAYRRVLRDHAREVLDYGDPRGEPKLREAIAAMLSDRRGIAATADDIIVTRGAQMALWLIARILLSPGDRVAVEEHGYPPAWLAMKAQGAGLVPISVDAEGLRVDALQALLEADPGKEGRVRAVYTTPHHQFPTMVTLHATRRLRLLELARRHGIAVIEDDYDNEYHYEGRPVLPLASVDSGGSVLYVGTLSKVLAPGLRIGFVVAPRPLIDAMAAERTFIDRQGDRAMEQAVAELMEDGDVQRHVWRTRREYLARRDALVHALRTRLGSVVEFDVPSGGLALWARVARGVDVDAWADRAAAQGVVFQPGRHFAFDEKKKGPGLHGFARFGFARLDEKEIAEAVRRLEAALPRSL